jgi:hypothetical protein
MLDRGVTTAILSRSALLGNSNESGDVRQLPYVTLMPLIETMIEPKHISLDI